MSVWTRPVLPALSPGRLSPIMSMALIALATLATAAAGFAAYALFAPDAGGTTAAQSDWKAPLPAVVELGEPKPASADVQTLTRPIFDKDRRPAKKAAAAISETKKIEETPAGYSVAAIVKHVGVAQAYIVNNGVGDWRKVGDKVDAWTVSGILADEVTLSNDAASVRLQLYNAEPRPADAAPPSRPAPPPGVVPPEVTAAPPPPPSLPPPPPATDALPGEAVPPPPTTVPAPTPDANAQQRRP